MTDDIEARAREIAPDIIRQCVGVQDLVYVIVPIIAAALRAERERALEEAADWMRHQSLKRSAGMMLHDLRDKPRGTP